jgi:hypothetical protein
MADQEHPKFEALQHQYEEPDSYTPRGFEPDFSGGSVLTDERGSSKLWIPIGLSVLSVPLLLSPSCTGATVMPEENPGNTEEPTENESEAPTEEPTATSEPTTTPLPTETPTPKVETEIIGINGALDKIYNVGGKEGPGTRPVVVAESRTEVEESLEQMSANTLEEVAEQGAWNRVTVMTDCRLAEGVLCNFAAFAEGDNQREVFMNFAEPNENGEWHRSELTKINFGAAAVKENVWQVFEEGNLEVLINSGDVFLLNNSEEVSRVLGKVGKNGELISGIEAWERYFIETIGMRSIEINGDIENFNQEADQLIGEDRAGAMVKINNLTGGIEDPATAESLLDMQLNLEGEPSLVIDHEGGRSFRLSHQGGETILEEIDTQENSLWMAKKSEAGWLPQNFEFSGYPAVDVFESPGGAKAGNLQVALEKMRLEEVDGEYCLVSYEAPNGKRYSKWVLREDIEAHYPPAFSRKSSVQPAPEETSEPAPTAEPVEPTEEATEEATPETTVTPEDNQTGETASWINSLETFGIGKGSQWSIQFYVDKIDGNTVTGHINGRKIQTTLSKVSVVEVQVGTEVVSGSNAIKAGDIDVGKRIIVPIFPCAGVDRGTPKATVVDKVLNDTCQLTPIAIVKK